RRRSAAIATSGPLVAGPAPLVATATLPMDSIARLGAMLTLALGRPRVLQAGRVPCGERRRASVCPMFPRLRVGLVSSGIHSRALWILPLALPTDSQEGRCPIRINGFDALQGAPGEDRVLGTQGNGTERAFKPSEP